MAYAPLWCVYPPVRPTPDDALAHALGAHATELRAFARERLPGGDGAEDAVQESFAALAATLRAGVRVEQPRAWLFRALRNRLTDLHRRRAARPALVALPPGDEAADRWAVDASDRGGGADAEAFWPRVEEALAALPPAQREVFERNVLDGETLREIADDLGVAIGTAISRKRYARLRLEGELRGLYEAFFAGD